MYVSTWKEWKNSGQSQMENIENAMWSFVMTQEAIWEPNKQTKTTKKSAPYF